MIHLEVLALVCLGTLVFRYQINGTIKRCVGALHRPGNATLLLHILVSLAEVVRYYARRYYSEYYLPYSSSNTNNKSHSQTVDKGRVYDHHDYHHHHVSVQQGPLLPTADLLDLFLMLVQCHTSLVLARDRVWAGHKSILRPVYHSQTLFRILLTAGSFFLSSSSSSSFSLLPLFFRPLLSKLYPVAVTTLTETWRRRNSSPAAAAAAQLYRASVMVNASFVYPRLLVWSLRRLGGVGPLGRRYRDVYTLAIFLGAVVAMHDGGVALGPQLYVAGVAGFVVLERWVAREVAERRKRRRMTTTTMTMASGGGGGVGMAMEGKGKGGGEKEDDEVVLGDDDVVLAAKGGGLAKIGLRVKDRLVDFLYWYGFVEIDMLRSGTEDAL